MAVEYLPAAQSVQSREPFAVLYFPAAHAVHGPPSLPVKPTLQTQLVDAADAFADCELFAQARHMLTVVAPTTAEYVFTPQSMHVEAPRVPEYLPAEHRAHTALPTASAYDPAAHAAHAAPSAPAYPGAQRQAAGAVCPVPTVAVFGGHAVHVELAAAPMAAE